MNNDNHEYEIEIGNSGSSRYSHMAKASTLSVRDPRTLREAMPSFPNISAAKMLPEENVPRSLRSQWPCHHRGKSSEQRAESKRLDAMSST